MMTFESVVGDLRHALRTLRRTAPLSIAVTATLTVGVGVNSVVFSLVNGLLFRSPATREPSTFVAVYAQPSGQHAAESHGPDTMATLEDFDILRSASRTMTVTAARWVSFRLGSEDGPSLRGRLASCNYLAAHLGAIRIGRGLLDTDCVSGAAPVVVLSERAWALHFGRDPAIIGAAIRLNALRLTVVGVAPDDRVDGPVAAMFYVPFTLQPLLQGPADFFRDPPARHAWLNLSGRLRPGASIAQAQSELRVIATSIDRLHPGRSTGLLVTDGAIIHEPGTARSIPPLIVLGFGVSAMILLMVCANVTALQLARAVSRRREMAVRAALGGGHLRLLRQLLTESLLLAGCAGVAGVALAEVLTRRLAQSLTDFPLLDAFAPDWRVMAFTLGLAGAAGCLAAVVPALETLRFDLAGMMQRTGSAGITPLASRLRGPLLTNQMSVSVALLIAVLLVVRAEHALLDVTRGAGLDAVMVSTIDLSHAGYTGPSARAFYDRLMPALAELPDVTALALASPPPYRGSTRTAFVRDDARGRVLLAESRAVSSGYFAAAGVRLSKGRLFSELEGRAPAATMPIVVSEAFARTFFAGEDVIGRRIRFRNDDVAQVVGMVGDTSSVRPMQTDGPMLYQPIYAASLPGLAAVLHFNGDSRRLVRGVRAQVAAVDARLNPVSETLAATVSGSATEYSALARLMAIPAGLALFLALAGIYGLTAFAATERRREIGVRLALGAGNRDIVRLFLGGLGRPLLVAALSGALLAAVSVMALQSANGLVHIPPGDPFAYAVALALLTITAGTAALIPALRAAGHDPWRALSRE